MNTHLLDTRLTGDPRVDARYETLLEAVCCIRDYLMTSPGSPRVRSALQLLFREAPELFQAEEAAMRATAYPKLEAHAASHAVLLLRLRHIEDAVEARSYLPELPLYGLCSDWLSGHQMLHDREMAEHLRGQENPSAAVATWKKGGLAVLLDESETMRAVYERLLSPYTAKGLRVVNGNNGVEGLDHLRRNQGGSLAIANWDMPIMNGLDFVHAVRKEEPLCATPIVLVGIGADAEHRQKALAEGATAYIAKHLISYELPPLLKRFLEA